MKKIILSADDFGMNPAVSAGISQLIINHRISATSCMTNNQYWSENAKLLIPYTNKIDIGLHFNLPQPLWKLIITSNLRTICRKQIIIELNRQLDSFEQALKKQPDFIDGHQHIQQLPIISDILFSIYQKRLTNKPYIRLTTTDNAIGTSPLKQFIIRLISANDFTQQLQDLNIPHNSSFSGIYNFHDKHHKYQQLFPKFLAASSNGGIIMCHPGLASDSYPDPINSNRQQELNYFLSNKFLSDCDKEHVLIVRWRELQE
ncbi:MAG: ChbG/HpnK family deacetylase [Gammaproteobacteria bacterium]|nr:ChbG/HpnK family deacetylase [Gammaproteobacteria bacterium]